MSKNKTQPTKSNVTAFLEAVSPPQKREDCQTPATFMQEITCEKPVHWGKSIVGFGSYSYRYASGRKGTWFLSGFSPIKNAITLYLFCNLDHPALALDKLVNYKRGKGCLYIKTLADINVDVLKRLIEKVIVLTKTH